MEQVFQSVGSFLLVLVYIFYLKQTIKGESTPNPATWLVWFVIMGINTITYFKIVDEDYFKTAIVIVGFTGITSIMIYSLIKGKFSKIRKLDFFLLIISIAIGIFWIISKNANISNLLLQIIIFISFLPTVIGLAQNRLKEKHLPWTLASVAYTLQTISLLINWDGNYYQLFLPIINGILGNGLIPIILITKSLKN